MRTKLLSRGVIELYQIRKRLEINRHEQHLKYWKRAKRDFTSQFNSYAYIMIQGRPRELEIFNETLYILYKESIATVVSVEGDSESLQLH